MVFDFKRKEYFLWMLAEFENIFFDRWKELNVSLLLWDLFGISLQIGLKFKVVVAPLNHDFVSIYDVIMVHHMSGPLN